MIKCLIVEDEIAGQEILARKMALQYPECKVLAIIDSKEKAIQFLNENEVDLVFMDVQIKGGTGIDVIKAVTKKTFETIFITAYDHHGIEALNNGASYYILKPIRDVEFKKGMALVLDKIKPNLKSNIIMVPNKGSYVSVNLENILYFESDGAYTKVVTEDESILSSKNIGYYEGILAAELYRRSHHSFIVNLSKIKSLKKGRGGLLKLSNGKEIPVSQRKLNDFLDYFTE